VNSLEKLTHSIFSQPTAPYKEGWVLTRIKKELTKRKISYFEDNVGNIVAGIKSKKQLKKSSYISLMAHTDHPGFHVIKKINSKLLLAQWHGGHPPKMNGAKVRLHNPHLPEKSFTGKVITVDKKHALKIKLNKALQTNPLNLFGAFDFPGYKKVKSKIVTRAADDLAGCVIIISVLEKLKNKKVIGVFTRAEEVGFKGALHLLEQKTLALNTPVISLEASRTLPGARLGKGCVIRLGDKRSLFDSDIIKQIDEAAERLQKKKKIKFQRRIMDGGSCEATACRSYGVPAAGIAVPLFNYHNQRPDGKSGPEMIHLYDVDVAIQLLIETCRDFDHQKLDKVRKALSSAYKKQMPMLNKTMRFKERE
jgi:endoglucanase